jgi:hypothetical protein
MTKLGQYKLYFLFSHLPFAIYKIGKICINKVKKLADIVDQRRTPWYFLLHVQEVPYVSAYRIHVFFVLCDFNFVRSGSKCVCSSPFCRVEFENS